MPSPTPASPEQLQRLKNISAQAAMAKRILTSRRKTHNAAAEKTEKEEDEKMLQNLLNEI